MVTTFPDLVFKSAEPLLEALQSRPATWPPDEAEDLLLMVRQGREWFQRCWKRTQAKLRAGLSGEQARAELAAMKRLANQEVLILGLVIKSAGQADETRLAEATEALREAEEIEGAAGELLDFVSQPPAPVDREDIARARAEWERGEGLDAEAMLARRKDRRPA